MSRRVLGSLALAVLAFIAFDYAMDKDAASLCARGEGDTRGVCAQAHD